MKDDDECSLWTSELAPPTPTQSSSDDDNNDDVPPLAPIKMSLSRQYTTIVDSARRSVVKRTPPKLPKSALKMIERNKCIVNVEEFRPANAYAGSVQLKRELLDAMRVAVDILRAEGERDANIAAMVAQALPNNFWRSYRRGIHGPFTVISMQDSFALADEINRNYTGSRTDLHEVYMATLGYGIVNEKLLRAMYLIDWAFYPAISGAKRLLTPVQSIQDGGWYCNDRSLPNEPVSFSLEVRTNKYSHYYY
jgi:hypothetical protein